MIGNHRRNRGESMKKLLLLILGLAWFSQSGMAQDLDRTGTAAAQFLKLPMDARVAALAGAFTAVENDPASLGINPAGIGRLPDKIVCITYQRLYLSLFQQAARFVWPLGRVGVLGWQSQYFSSGRMEITTVEQPEGTGQTFRTGSLEASLTFAHPVTDRVALGVSLKYIRESIYHETASTLAFDLGTIVRTGLWGTIMGVSLTNVGGKMHLRGEDLYATSMNFLNLNQNLELKTQDWPLPAVYRIGFSFPAVGPNGKLFKSAIQEVFVHGVLNDANDAPLQERLGIEYLWNHILALRGGWFLHHSTARWSLGAGLQYPFSSFIFRLNYAFQHSSFLTNVQWLTLSLIFAGK